MAHVGHAGDATGPFEAFKVLAVDALPSAGSDESELFSFTKVGAIAQLLFNLICGFLDCLGLLGRLDSSTVIEP
ncbi:hypothetical protein [Paracoccus actinidiae]|jgi:hypothetical protein|uniref:hypothetical protein n=1 Tax=Paracoccus actinidiae TaxID=3064531 RepID=UPI0027D2A612|nr:hypothetical protein [Paracoccus sp. M09]